VTPGPEQLAAMAAAVQPVVRRAGARLLDRQREFRREETEFKGRRELVTAADREAERAVVEFLLDAYPEHAVLAEEGVLTPRGRPHRDAELVWILDPLDGTTNFVHGLPFFAVALALLLRGAPVLGVVHAPALATTYVAVQGRGAERDGAPIRVSSTGTLSSALLATGFSYNRNEPGRDDNSKRLAAALPLCRDLRRFGSAALDLCLVAAGHFDAYWELYLAPYDVAAGALIVREAGGRVTDLAGGEEWLFGGHILASNGRLHDAVRTVVGPPPPSA
jgi:myo-inositol-1(or 4)-monophosphatase